VSKRWDAEVMTFASCLPMTWLLTFASSVRMRGSLASFTLAFSLRNAGLVGFSHLRVLAYEMPPSRPSHLGVEMRSLKKKVTVSGKGFAVWIWSLGRCSKPRQGALKKHRAAPPGPPGSTIKTLRSGHNIASHSLDARLMSQGLDASSVL
jgi:hypothetical protein